MNTKKYKIDDLIGKKYGMLTVVSKSIIQNKKNSKIDVRCDCGNTVSSLFYDVIHGHTTSCGCKGRKITIERNTKHGLANSDIYRLYKNIKTRCNNKNCPDYKNYGGRGITICKDWLSDFNNFYNWCLDNGYKKGLQIDRKDNNGNYEPANCRFVTQEINCNNRRNNIYVNYNGIITAVGFVLKANGISQNAFYSRVKRGWTIEDALKRI